MPREPSEPREYPRRASRVCTVTLAVDDETTATCLTCGEGFAPGSTFSEYRTAARDEDDEDAVAWFHYGCEP